MRHNLEILFGAIIILYGILLLTRRKFAIRETYVNLFFPGILILPQMMEAIKEGKWLWALPLWIGAFIIVIVVGKYRVTLTNVDSQMVSTALAGVLKEQGISYEKYKNRIILKEYEHKEIKYMNSLNSVSIDFNGIKDLPFYKEVEGALIHSIQKNDEKVFPSAGLFYMALGVVLLVIVL